MVEKTSMKRKVGRESAEVKVLSFQLGALVSNAVRIRVRTLLRGVVTSENFDFSKSGGLSVLDGNG